MQANFNIIQEGQTGEDAPTILKNVQLQGLQNAKGSKKGKKGAEEEDYEVTGYED